MLEIFSEEGILIFLNFITFENWIETTIESIKSRKVAHWVENAVLNENVHWETTVVQETI